MAVAGGRGGEERMLGPPVGHLFCLGHYSEQILLSADPRHLLL